jgi:putative membrane protein
VTIFPLVRAEFARLFASRLGTISLIALMTVPIIYGGLYLWGNKDPYGSLDKVPAALVVSDTGAKLDGKTVNYGDTVGKTLVDDKEFDWHEVSASKAAAGVRNGTYDFALSFPASFSTSLTSASGDAPTKAKLTLTTDDTNSYLSTTIAKQVAESVRTEIAAEVGKSASVKLLGSISSIRSGLVKAEDGATKLADGAATANTGAASLASGSATLATGAASLSTGLAQLDAKAAGLPASAAALSSGAASVSSGIAKASTAATALAANTASAKALYNKLTADLQASLGIVTPQVQQDIVNLGTPVYTADGYASALTSTATGLPAAAAGAAQVATGAATLSASAPTLSNAVHSAATGAATLSSGASSAATGASDLSTGVSQLASGSATLSSSLSDAVTKIPATTKSDRSASAKLIADPLTVKQNAITEAQDYGAGLAPFFMSLASWIGIYALFLIVRPLSRRALTAVRRPIRTTLAGWLVPAILGLIQMVGLFAIVTAGLHLTVAHPVELLLFLGFVAITYAAVVLALNVLLGSVGQFLALVFMVIQLVTAGGTFPWQTLPGPLAALHQVLPMSHAVDGIRVLMYGGSGSALSSSILPLLFWMIGSLVAATLGARRQGKFRTLTQLRPSAIGG